MDFEALVRILKLNGNCNVSQTTLRKYGKRRIEEECGFKIRIENSKNCSTNFILEREY